MSNPEITNHIVGSLQSQRNLFNCNYHSRIDSEVCGLYAFWLRSGCCLYVGQSEDIRDRMYKHFMQEHNLCLAEYFKAFPQDIEVSYVTLCGWSVAKLGQYEDELIEILRAICNVARKKTLQQED